MLVHLSQPDYLTALERQPGVRKPTLEALKTKYGDETRTHAKLRAALSPA